MPSKFELLRLCKATGATARANFGCPTADELGFAKSISVQVGRDVFRAMFEVAAACNMMTDEPGLVSRLMFSGLMDSRLVLKIQGFAS